MAVLVETTIGSFVIELFVKQRPRTCLNFVKLCKLKKYNLCVFHSVEEGFIAQTGDPSGTGRGGQSIFADLFGDQAAFFEMESLPKLRHLKTGQVSMVNNGENMHGSQFFITLEDKQDYLDDKHTVFGMLDPESLDFVQKLNTTLCDDEKRPYRDIRITHTIILDDPFDDPEGLIFPSRSPSPTEDILKNGRLAVDELIDEDEGKDVTEIQEEIEAKEARARAHILEMVGDLHHADERPPDNVLFVCKLNAITTDEDLNIIFSRFGPIKCCEIIKDKKTSASLQYAFIEFEQPEHCEAAYFKMDNVLIDDRRIHVDFSQSVSKNYTWDRTPATSTGPLEEQSKHKATDSKKQRDDHRTLAKDGRSQRSRDVRHSPERSRHRHSPNRANKDTQRSRDKSRERRRSPEKSRRHHRSPDRSSRRDKNRR